MEVGGAREKKDDFTGVWKRSLLFFLDGELKSAGSMFSALSSKEVEANERFPLPVDRMLLLCDGEILATRPRANELDWHYV